MKKIIRNTVVFITFLLAAASLFGEGSEEYVKQEINASSRCLPVFYENIKSRWTFKMGYKDGVDFAQWKGSGL